MALSKESKKKIIKDIIEKLRESKGIVLIDYKGMNVSQINSIREGLKEKNVQFRIVKNSLVERASEELNIKEITKDLVGCTAITFSDEDTVAPARLLKEIFKKNKIELRVKAGLVEGNILGPEQIMQVASLPSKEVLIAQVVAGIKSPLYSLVLILQSPLRGLVYTLETIRKKKEEEVKVS